MALAPCCFRLRRLRSFWRNVAFAEIFLRQMSLSQGSATFCFLFWLYFSCGFSAVAFSSNFSIYVVGSPLACPLGRLGPLTHPLVCHVSSNHATTCNNIEPCTDSLELCRRVLHLRKSEQRKFGYQQTRPNGTLVFSSYSAYIRMLVTWPLFISRARVVLGSELRLLMSFSWPVFPGLDQVLFFP